MRPCLTRATIPSLSREPTPFTLAFVGDQGNASTLSQGHALMLESGFSEEQIATTSDKDIRWFKGHVLGTEHGSEGGERPPCGANFALPSLSL